MRFFLLLFTLMSFVGCQDPASLSKTQEIAHPDPNPKIFKLIVTSTIDENQRSIPIIDFETGQPGVYKAIESQGPTEFSFDNSRFHLYRLASDKRLFIGTFPISAPALPLHQPGTYEVVVNNTASSFEAQPGSTLTLQLQTVQVKGTQAKAYQLAWRFDGLSSWYDRQDFQPPRNQVLKQFWNKTRYRSIWVSRESPLTGFFKVKLPREEDSAFQVFLAYQPHSRPQIFRTASKSPQFKNENVWEFNVDEQMNIFRYAPPLQTGDASLPLYRFTESSRDSIVLQRFPYGDYSETFDPLKPFECPYLDHIDIEFNGFKWANGSGPQNGIKYYRSRMVEMRGPYPFYLDALKSQSRWHPSGVRFLAPPVDFPGADLNVTWLLRKQDQSTLTLGIEHLDDLTVINPPGIPQAKVRIHMPQQNLDPYSPTSISLYTAGGSLIETIAVEPGQTYERDVLPGNYEVNLDGAVFPTTLTTQQPTDVYLGAITIPQEAQEYSLFRKDKWGEWIPVTQEARSKDPILGIPGVEYELRLRILGGLPGEYMSMQIRLSNAP